MARSSKVETLAEIVEQNHANLEKMRNRGASASKRKLPGPLSPNLRAAYAAQMQTGYPSKKNPALELRHTNYSARENPEALAFSGVGAVVYEFYKGGKMHVYGRTTASSPTFEELALWGDLQVASRILSLGETDHIFFEGIERKGASNRKPVYRLCYGS